MTRRRHVVVDIEAVRDPSIPAKEGSEGEPARFDPPVCWEIVAIGCFSFVDFVPEMFGCVQGADERTKVASYVSFIEKEQPVVVTWNGRHFDNPVMGHRALRYGLAMPSWYGSARGPRYRYGDRSLDLKDVLADYGAAASGSLNQIAHLIGWPGKGEIRGEHVAELHAAGKHAEIDRYCLSDVAQLAAAWLRYEVLRGTIKPKDWPSIAATFVGYLESQPMTRDLIERVDRALFIGPKYQGQLSFTSGG